MSDVEPVEKTPRNFAQSADNYLLAPEMPCFWRSGIPRSEKVLMPNLEKLVDDILSKKIELCGSDEKRIKVTIKDLPVKSSGFDINGFAFFFPKSEKVTVLLEYHTVLNRDGRSVLKLVEARYQFFRPVLAAANLEINVTLGDIFKKFMGGTFSGDDLLSILERMTISEFDKSKAGAFVKPIIVAFDSLIITNGKSGKPSVTFKTEKKEYLNNGWGIFSFGIYEKGCVGADKDHAPGEFLGDGWGGDGKDSGGIGECREVETGPKTRQALQRWMMKKWQNDYERYLAEAENNAVAAMVTLTNSIMSIGADPSKGDWDKWAIEEKKLGRNYLEWKKRRK